MPIRLAWFADNTSVVPSARKDEGDIGIRMIVDCVDRPPRSDVVSFRSDDKHGCMNILERGRTLFDHEVARRQFIVEIEASQVLRMHLI